MKMSLARYGLIEYMKNAKELGLSQKAIAKMIGCSPSFFCQLLSGEKPTPSIIMADKIRKITKIEIADWNKPYDNTEKKEN